jgi:hypothetical protein
MPLYHKLGKIPHKRHTTFRKEDGSLYYEQLFGTIGFDGMSSRNVLTDVSHPQTYPGKGSRKNPEYRPPGRSGIQYSFSPVEGIGIDPEKRLSGKQVGDIVQRGCTYFPGRAPGIPDGLFL